MQALAPAEYDAVLDALDAMDATARDRLVPLLRGILAEAVVACWPHAAPEVLDPLRSAPTLPDAALARLHRQYLAEQRRMEDLVIVPLGEVPPPLPPDRLDRARFSAAAATVTRPTAELDGLADWLDELLGRIGGPGHPTLRRLVGAAGWARAWRALDDEPVGRALLADADGGAVLGDWLAERDAALSSEWRIALARCRG